MSDKRFHELDVFRGIAAIAVVLFHYTTLYHEKVGHPQAPIFEFSYGHYGVELFFIISGFVISLTLNRTKTHSDFIVSRFSRLYPVYWAAVILTFLVVTIWEIPGQNHSVEKTLVNLLMFQGLFGYPYVDGVYWSLQYELLFYMYMLIFFSVGWLNHIQRISIIWLSLQLICCFCNYYFGYFPWKIQYFLILDYGNLFIAGILFNQLHGGVRNKYQYPILFICIATQFLRDGVISGGIVGLFFILFLLFSNGRLKWISIPLLVYLGTISYSLYLTHQNIGYALFIQMHNIGMTTNLSIFIMLIIAILIAHMLTFYVERPAMKFIRSVYKKKAS